MDLQSKLDRLRLLVNDSERPVSDTTTQEMTNLADELREQTRGMPEFEAKVNELYDKALHIVRSTRFSQPLPPVSPVKTQNFLPTSLPDTSSQVSDDTLFSTALKKAARAAGVTIDGALQAGAFTSGYQTTGDGGEQAVLKLPTADSWVDVTYFRETAAAVRNETNVLPAANRALSDTDTPYVCAIPVGHLSDGEISITGWPLQVPWLSQRFARGQRLSQQGMLPMRGSREKNGLQILFQTITMVQRLRTHQIAHRDIKPDALFWDNETSRLEVIDWNRGTLTPTDADWQQEFEILKRLVMSVLLGGMPKEEEKELISLELCHSFRGTAISRGSRLVLHRLLDSSHARTLTNIDELATAVNEIYSYWQGEPLAQQPVAGISLEDISAQLSLLSVEAMREPSGSPAPGMALQWFADLYERGQAEAERSIRSWLAGSLRASFRRLEDAWTLIPDIWPLSLLVPMARLWLSEMPREHDAQLADLSLALTNHQWERADNLIPRTSPAQLQPYLNALRQALINFRTLEQAQALRHISAPLSDQLVAVRPLRNTFSSDPRVQLLLLEVDQLADQIGQAARQREILAELDCAKPLAQNQIRRLDALEALKRLEYNDDRLPAQQALVKQIRMAADALAAAHELTQQHDYQQAQAVLSPWLSSTELSSAAPDLTAAIQQSDAVLCKLISQADYAARLAAVDQALRNGSLVDARASLLLDGAPATEHAGIMLKSLDSLEDIISTLGQAEYQKAAQLVPASRPCGLLALAEEVVCIGQLGASLGVNNLPALIESARLAFAYGHDRPYTRLFSTAIAQLHRVAGNNLQAQVQQALQAGSFSSNIEEARALLIGHNSLAAADTDRAVNNHLGARLSSIESLITSIQRDLQAMEFSERELADKVLPAFTDTSDRLQQLEQRLDRLSTSLDTNLQASIQAVTSKQSEIADKMLPTLTNTSDRLQQLEQLVNSVTNQLDKLVGERTPPASAPQTPNQDDVTAASLPEIESPSSAPKSPLRSQRYTLNLWPPSLPVIIGVVLVAVVVIGVVLQSPSLPVIIGVVLVAVVVIGVVFSLALSRLPDHNPARRFGIKTKVSDPPLVQIRGPISTTLGMSLTLIAPNPAARTVWDLAVLDTTVPLSVTEVASNSVQLRLPRTLFAAAESFALPMDVTLLAHDSFAPFTFTIEPSQMVVSGGFPDLTNPDYYPAGEGWLLWETATASDRQTEALKPKGADEASDSFMVLRAGDQVQILGGQGQRYQVLVFVNDAGNDIPENVTGWVHRNVIFAP